MNAPREALEDRRENLTETFDWESPAGSVHRLIVTVGLYDDGRSGEVFATGPKTGSTLRATVEDICVLASHLRQRGVPFRHQARMVGREPDGRASSPAGAILDMAAAIELDLEEARP